MREKLLSIGDDFWIEDDAGERAYKVDGKAVRRSGSRRHDHGPLHLVSAPPAP